MGTWYMINSAMVATALATLGAGLLFVMATLYAAGFYIDNLGYCWGAIGAWVAATICLISGLYVLLYLFPKAYRKQKARDAWEDSSKGL